MAGWSIEDLGRFAGADDLQISPFREESKRHLGCNGQRGQSCHLQLEAENFSNNKKSFYPPEKLNTSDTPQADARAGTLAYYAPWGDVVMFYDRFGSAAGLYELGHAVSGSEYIRGMSGTIHIEKVSAPWGGVISGG